MPMAREDHFTAATIRVLLAAHLGEPITGDVEDLVAVGLLTAGHELTNDGRDLLIAAALQDGRVPGGAVDRPGAGWTAVASGLLRT